MNKLIDEKLTIYNALKNIENGKYVMPAFQRQFVWGMEQIEKLWDSILLDYPIATFLLWKVDDTNITKDTYFCRFLEEVTFDSRKQSDSTNYGLTSINTEYTDIAILDGQQRLTSLFLSLLGNACIRPNYARKKTENKVLTKLLIELNKNKVAVDEEEYNSKKFDIKFSEKIARLSPTQFEIKIILEERFQNDDTREIAIEESIKNVPNDSKEYARTILNKLYNKIFIEKLIRYTEIRDMKQDDALEMFVRFNNGGKSLKKSEITMSILEAYWPSAKTEFGKILIDSYKNFDTDFIIRSSLMLFGDVVKSTINKKISEDLKNNWNEFKNSLKNLESILHELKIDINRFSGSWNVLLPIIYYIYYNPDYTKNINILRSYLLRAIFFTYFQSGTTGKLQQMKSKILDIDFDFTIDMLDSIPALKVTDGKIEDLLSLEKGDRVTGEVLYYISLDWINKSYKYEQDHLHPDNKFNESKPYSVSIQDWSRWRGMRNRLPNLQLLEGRSNGSKSDMRLIDFYNDMNNEQKIIFHKQAFIPKDISLEIEKFEEFYNKRKDLLIQKIKELLG